jgi:mono/diheme cytochrome c family protein
MSGCLWKSQMKFVTIGMAFCLISITAVAQAPPEQTKQLYERECAVCHGLNGDGKGDAAYLLFPKPRDFTAARFKIQSTPTGSPPTDEDLFNTVTRGMPGSAMPGFTRLTEEQRRALVEYIKTFSGKFDDAEPTQPVVPGPEPSMTPETLARGAELYDGLGCFDCHGVTGKGDGPAAPTLKDSDGLPIRPNNFTRGIYKGGGGNVDIYMRFTTGMTGTPMPSYEMVIDEADRWALVYYVKSLAGDKVAAQPSTGLISAKRIDGAVPKNPIAEGWEAATPNEIPLMLLWQRQETIESVAVRALHNGREIAFLLEWEDLSPEARFIRHQDFTDGAAIQFALSENPPPFPMGTKNEPVNMWHWRGDRQMDLDEYADVEDVYPNLVNDEMQSLKDYYAVGTYTATDKPSQTIVPVPGHDKTFITAWGAGNPMANPWRSTPIEDLNAVGFGTLTAQNGEEQNVSGIGFWVEGKWRVVFIRTIHSDDKFDVKFQPGQKVPIAFAVWDGAKGDRNGQKAVTTWYTLQVEK